MTSDELLRRRGRIRFLIVVAGVLVVGVSGYLGFLAFVGSGPELAAGVLALAAGTGFAAFFSPCSFPLLLTFLVKRSESSRVEALMSALRVGGGAGALLAIVAVVTAVGGSALARVVEFDSLTGRVFRLAIGITLLAFGLRQSGVLRLQMTWPDRVASTASRLVDSSRSRGKGIGDVVYGFGYLLVGFG